MLIVGRARGVRVLPRPGFFENRQDGSQHAKGVQVQRAVRDVVVLQIQPLVVLDVRAPVAGPPACEAGLHLVVQRSAAMLLQLSRDKGPRADDGHVAGHDVEELGQLVERRLAQDAAHGGDAGVVVQLLAPVPFLAPPRILEQLRQHLVGVPHHGAQLPKLEGLAPQADARLLVEDGVAVAGGEIGDLHDGGDGQGDGAAGDAQQQIECALGGEVDGLRGAEGVALQVERLHDADLPDLLHFRGNAEGFREADAHLKALGHEFLDGRVVHLRGRSQDDDLVRVGERAEGKQVGAGGGGSLEEHVDHGGVGEAEADDAGGLHVVGVKALLGLFGVLRRADEHDALDAVLWAIAPAREEPPLVQVLQDEGEARIARVHDDDHFAREALTHFQEVEKRARRQEALKDEHQLDADVFPVAAPEDAAVGIGEQREQQIAEHEEREQSAPGGGVDELEVPELEEIGRGERHDECELIEEEKVGML